MSKRAKRVVVVDPDDKSRRILEVSLRKAGYDAVGAEGAREALALLESTPTDLLISETELPDASGFDLCRHARAQAELESVPFIFVTHAHDMAEKLRALELGVEDYLAKPVYVAEVRARVEILLQRRETEMLAEAQAPTVRGSLSDVSLVDLFRTIESGRKTGALRLERHGHRASVYFSEGEPVDARADLLVGEEAVYRLLTWSEGEFVLKVLPALRRPRRIEASFTDLVLEGLQRSEQYDAVQQGVVSTGQVLRVNYRSLANHVEDLPELVHDILRLFDGRRPVSEVVEASPVGDLGTIKIVQRLLAQDLLEEVPGLDDDDAEAFAAVAQDELGDWLGSESQAEREEREERERRRAEEEARLRAELEQLQAMQSELDERLRAAEEARKAAEVASAELKERRQTLTRRLTGELQAATDDHPVTSFQPTPSAERRAVPPPRPKEEEVVDWLGLAGDPDLEGPAPTAPRERARVDTFDYPALKMPPEDATPEPAFRSGRDRIDTNPRFRSDMAAEAVRPEILELRTSIDAERRRIEQARRAARDEERRVSESQRALERAKSAYDELERADELRKLRAEQGRLEAERKALLAQRERLQADLEAERAQLEGERVRLEEAAEARRRAQAEEEARLRAELEQARLEREKEEQHLLHQREEGERLRREAEAQQAAVRARSGDTPAIDAQHASVDVRSLATAEPAPRRPIVTPVPAEAEAEARAVRPTGPLPAAVHADPDGAPEAPPDDSDSERRLRTVEEARRRLLDAAQRGEERLLGRRVDTPGPSVPSITRAEPSDTPQRLAAIAESRKRLSSLLSDGEPGPERPTEAAEPERRTAAPVAERERPADSRATPPAGLVAVGEAPAHRHSRATPPRVPEEARRPAAERTPEAEAAAAPAEAPAPLPVGSGPEAAGVVRAPDDDFDEHGFFSGDQPASQDDLFAALYDGEAPSRRGRNLLWGTAILVAAFAITLAVVSGDGNNEPHETAAPTPPTEQDLTAWRSDADLQGRETAGGVAAAVTLVGQAQAVGVAFQEALDTVETGFDEALAPEGTGAGAPEDEFLIDTGAGELAADAEAATPEPGVAVIAEVAPEEAAPEEAAPDEAPPTPEAEEEAPPRRRAEAAPEEPLARIRPAEEPAPEGLDDAETIDVERATQRARELLGEGEYGEAAAEARLILEADPLNRRAHQLLGECLLNLDDAREAVPHLEAATHARRPDDHALLLLGNAQLELGDDGAATATYRRFLELYPNSEEAPTLRQFLEH